MAYFLTCSMQMDLIFLSLKKSKTDVFSVRNTMPTLPEGPSNFHCKKFLELEESNFIVVY